MSENEPPHEPSIRHVRLPSGEWIELIRFHESKTERELHICPSCDSDLVQPIHWSQNADDTWNLTLECPNCLYEETGDFSLQQIEKFEVKLDKGLDDTIDALSRLSQANMNDDVNRFISSLDAGLILPEDF